MRFLCWLLALMACASPTSGPTGTRHASHTRLSTVRSAAADQPEPRQLDVITRSATAVSFWVVMTYQLPGNPDSVITSVLAGTTGITHRLPATVLRDSFNIPIGPDTTISGSACAVSKRRGQFSPSTCKPFSFTNSSGPPPPPVLDSVWTDSAHVLVPVLFRDSFANGVRAPPQNGIRWTHASAGQGDSLSVRPSTTSPSGFALRFFFLGNPNTGDDAWSEQNGELPFMSEVFFCLWYRIPPNYFHRDVSPANNKGIRIYGGLTNTASRDSAYQHSAVKSGYSTLPYTATQTPPPTGESSKLIAEYGANESGTGNWGTGSYKPWWKPGTLERMGIYTKAGTMTRPRTAADSTSNPQAGDATIQIWRNGVLWYSRANLAIFTVGAPNTFRYFYLLGWANSGFPVNTAIDLEKVEISVRPTAHCISP